jgi:hypothetical protein
VVFFKCADDTSVLVPEITDVCLADEFENIKKCASHNKMIIKLNKIKEIVFQRPNPRHCLYPDPLAYIDQVHETEILGPVMNNSFVFNAHVQYTMRQCAPRFYLMKLLRKQGLPHRQLCIVFQAIIVAYCMQLVTLYHLIL